MAKSKTKKLGALQQEAVHLRKKMISSRLTGILACIVALASIVVFYLKVINEWMCIIAIAYCLATIFTANSFIQDVKVGNPWQRINGICSILFYILVVFLIAYGFISKNLVLQF